MSETLYFIVNSCIFVLYIRYPFISPKTSHFCLALDVHTLVPFLNIQSTQLFLSGLSLAFFIASEDAPVY